MQLSFSLSLSLSLKFPLFYQRHPIIPGLFRLVILECAIKIKSVGFVVQIASHKKSATRNRERRGSEW